MKKNIKLNENHATLVRRNMENFKSKVLSQVAQNMNEGGLQDTGLTKPHSKLFGKADWTLSS